MSRPPEYPGSRRFKRAATRAGGGAYEGAFEAVGSILIATGLGYWFDRHYETTPIGVLVGAVVGFAAFVLRLIRLGRQLYPEEFSAEHPARGPGADETNESDGTDRADDADDAGRADTRTNEEQR